MPCNRWTSFAIGRNFFFMKRKILLSTLSLLGVLAFSITGAFAANNAPGSKCTKVDATAKSGTAKVKCVKSGKYLIWQKITPPTPTKPAAALCVVGNPCAMGTKGQGGGIVFYDAGSSQSWGRYLEAAPAGWSWSFIRNRKGESQHERDVQGHSKDGRISFRHVLVLI